MAIAQQYPLNTPKNSDLLVGTSIPDPNTNDNPKTSNFSVSSIGSFLIAENNIITGGGTLNTIPMWTPDGDTLGDSIITQNALGTTIAVNGIFTVDNALTVTNGGDTNVVGDLEVDSSLTVDDSTTLNGALTVSDLTTLDGALTVEGSSTFYNDATFEDTVVFQQDIGDSTASSGTPGQVLSSTGSATLWRDAATLIPNNITGSGTVEYIPKFTPDGTAIGNSIMFTKPNGTEIQVGVTDPSSTETTLGAGFVSTYAVGADVVTATNINAGASGTLTATGNIILGDATADTTTINSTLSILSVVKDSNDTLGTDGQILVANAASELLWSSINAVSEIKTAQATITDAQIRTLGTVPVEILPAVTGYIYEILGATTQSINSGGVGNAYDWGGQSGVISSRGSVFTNLHKVEIPNAQLPSGGGGISDSLYVGTPVAGLSRTNGSIKVTVTNNIDPTIPIAQTPSAQLLINITYKLTQVQ